jgi:hypothetical protein
MSDKMLEGFEAWAVDNGYSVDREEWTVVVKDYCDLSTRYAYEAYAAGRLAEREECAALCDDLLHAAATADDCAAAIRARGQQ